MQEIRKINQSKLTSNMYKILLPSLSLLYLTACQATTDPKISNIVPSVQNSDYVPVAMETNQPDYQSIEIRPLEPNSTIEVTPHEVVPKDRTVEENSIIVEEPLSTTPEQSNVVDLNTVNSDIDEPIILQPGESIVEVERVPDIEEIPNPTDTEVNPSNTEDSLSINESDSIDPDGQLDPNSSEETGLVQPEFDPTKRIMEGARKHSESRHIRSSRMPSVPAFRQLMNTGIQQLKSNELSKAENSFTKAQRIIPQSSAVYFYLGQIALKKRNPYRAEAFARRGLNVSDSKIRRSALWQVILKSAQMKGDKKTISEAKKALQ